jgi:hypothetical protein
MEVKVRRRVMARQLNHIEAVSKAQQNTSGQRLVYRPETISQLENTTTHEAQSALDDVKQILHPLQDKGPSYKDPGLDELL